MMKVLVTGAPTIACPKWDFETIASRAKEYGYDGVEVRGFLNESILTASNIFLSDPAKLMHDLVRHEVHLVTAHTKITRAVFPSKIWNSIALGTDAATCGGVKRIPPPITLETMMAAASSGPRRRSSSGSEMAAVERRTPGAYWVSNWRSI